MKNKIFANKILFLCIGVLFTLNTVLQAAPLIGSNLAFGPTFSLGQVFTPPLVTGIQVDDKNPFLFDFFVHPGDQNLSGENLDEEAKKMIRYFLASLTIPEKDLWVNLSPYEENRIVEKNFSETDMGRDLLAQDYLLKQVVTTLIYPEGEIGKKFWEKVYKKAYELFGTTEVSVDSLNKVWIVPDKAVVYERGNMAFVAESNLKVFMEKDYLASKEYQKDSLSKEKLNVDQKPKRMDFSDQIVQEVIIPELEKEVNFGKTFSPLRQIYHALILADWFKKKLSNSLINYVYTGKGKTSGIDVYDQKEAGRIYSQYIENYKKGTCDYLKAEYDPFLKKYVPRKYFSGGVTCMNVDSQVLDNPDDLSSSNLKNIKRDAVKYHIALQQAPSQLSSSISSDAILPKDGSIFNSEFAPGEFVRQLPEENREWHMENLKEWIIENAERYLNERLSGAIRWDIFMNHSLPYFGFSNDQILEIVDRLKVEEKSLKISSEGNRPAEWEMIESLKSSAWPYTQIMAKNIIAYLRFEESESAEKDFSEIFRSGQIFKENIIFSISGIKESYKLYPYLRQIIKDTFFLSSSKTERIDKLMRIAEREVNVSTHKGQDLLNFSNLKKILESNHQRRRTGPNATYDPEVTEALEELKILAASLIDKTPGAIDDVKEIVSIYCDQDILLRLEDAVELFSGGDNLEAILVLTNIRSDLYLLIVEQIKQADKINHSRQQRYGPHISQSQEKATIAYKLMEADILIEQMIVDSSTEAFSLVRSNASLKSFSLENVKDIILSVYIIAKNMSHSIGAQPALNVFADNLIKLRDSDHLGEEKEYYRIYGLIQQIEAELADNVDNLVKEFKFRVEAMQKNQGVNDYEDTPESLGFVQDFLISTMLRQFSERFLLDCRKIIDEMEGPQDLTMTVDSVSQRKVRKIVNVPVDLDHIPLIVSFESATEDQMRKIGSKAFGLYIMKKLGMPVPPWFVIRAKPRKDIFDINEVRDELENQIKEIEKSSGTKIGDPKNPLLFSLRSVFQVSMPGEFPTVLNVGMNQEVFEGLKESRGEKFALISYLAFLKTYADMLYPNLSDRVNMDDFLGDDQDIDSLLDFLSGLKIFLKQSKIKIPEDPWQQIEIIVDHIMNKSTTPEIENFLALHGLPDSWKVSVIFQKMEFGYLNDESYTAVAHTRDVMTGEDKFDIEAIYGATGESVVGKRSSARQVHNILPVEDEEMLEIFKPQLEKIFGGPVELEITRGEKLHFLQARTGHLGAQALKKSLNDLVQEKILTKEEAAFQIEIAETLSGKNEIFPNAESLVIAGGISGGVMAGPICLSLDQARKAMSDGENAILILENTPDRNDKSYYGKNLGVVTAHGGPSQHFSVWSRQYHMPYISMVKDIEIDLGNKKIKMGGRQFKEGDVVTMDGYRGLIFNGNVVKNSSPAGKGVGSSAVGGIDLSRTFESLNIKMDQSGSPLPVEFQDIDQIHIRGLIPVIINVVPVQNVSTLLGINAKGLVGF